MPYGAAAAAAVCMFCRVFVYKQGTYGWTFEPGVRAYPRYQVVRGHRKGEGDCTTWGGGKVLQAHVCHAKLPNLPDATCARLLTVIARNTVAGAWNCAMWSAGCVV
jgi:hypothetical protein